MSNYIEEKFKEFDEKFVIVSEDREVIGNIYENKKL